ncbi:Fc.00g041410.m01.CDS01 [Cosmosporella sp. VM-42]
MAGDGEIHYHQWPDIHGQTDLAFRIGDDEEDGDSPFYIPSPSAVDELGGELVPEPRISDECDVLEVTPIGSKSLERKEKPPNTTLQECITHIGDTIILAIGTAPWFISAIEIHSSNFIETCLTTVLKKSFKSPSRRSPPGRSTKHLSDYAIQVFWRNGSRIAHYVRRNGRKTAEGAPDDAEEQGDVLDVEMSCNLEQIDDFFFSGGAFSEMCMDIRRMLYDQNSPKMSSIETAVLDSFRSLRPRVCPTCSETPLGLSQEQSHDHLYPYTITLEVDWQPLKFLDIEFAERSPKLGSVITYTGFSSNAFATTCSEYLRTTWPSTGGLFLAALETWCQAARGVPTTKISSQPVSTPLGLIRRALPSPSLKGQLQEARLERTNSVLGLQQSADGNRSVPLALETSSATISAQRTCLLQISRQADDSLLIKAHGTKVILAEIAQQAVWVSSALRLSPKLENVPMCCEGLLSPVDEEGPSTHERRFAITCRFQEILPEDRSCWLSLVSHTAVISHHFPVPLRENESGLEIPLEILAEMAGVRHAVEFKGGVVMKGPTSMLVPISRKADIVQWHLVSSGDPDERLSYQSGINLCQRRALVDEVDLNSLRDTRVVVGWCSHARVMLGKEEMNYENLEYSTAGVQSSSLNFSGGAIGFQQFGAGHLNFAMGPKDAKVHFKRSGTYRKVLSWASKTNVLLYDTAERRAWLVHADDVILHIIRARGSREAFISNGKGVSLQEGSTSTESLRLNESILISDDGETFRDMVSSIWSMLEFLLDEDVQMDGRSERPLETPFKRKVSGYEFMGVVEERSPFQRKQCTIGKSGGSWTSLIDDTGALVLFASGFEDLIRPTEDMKGLCHAWNSMPKGKDYLATTVGSSISFNLSMGRTSISTWTRFNVLTSVQFDTWLLLKPLMARDEGRVIDSCHYGHIAESSGEYLLVITWSAVATFESFRNSLVHDEILEAMKNYSSKAPETAIVDEDSRRLGALGWKEYYVDLTSWSEGVIDKEPHMITRLFISFDSAGTTYASLTETTTFETTILVTLGAISTPDSSLAPELTISEHSTGGSEPTSTTQSGSGMST